MAELEVEFKRRLEQDGVVVIPKVFTEVQMSTFRAEYEKKWGFLKEQMNTLDKVEKPYTIIHDGKKTVQKNMYFFENTQITEFQPGRYSFTWGMDSGIFAEKEFFSPKPLNQLVREVLHCDYTHWNGAVPADKKSVVGSWHRDTWYLFEEKLDLTLPPFYLTIFVPLVPLNRSNGATEFILGSHKRTYQENQENEGEHATFDTEAGDVIIIDGRIIHRGGANLSDEPRPILYTVYHKLWYHEYQSVPQNLYN